jgi:hypothetical protein
MIFIGYESDSKVYHAYDPIMKHVHVTRDVVFDEKAQWDRGSGGDYIFTMETTTTGPVAPTVDGADEVPTEESPLSAKASDLYVDHDVDDENLYADHDDDALLRFPSMSDILMTPGFTPRALVAEELHMVSYDELASFTKDERSTSWRKAMMEKMDSIKKNGT